MVRMARALSVLAALAALTGCASFGGRLRGSGGSGGGGDEDGTCHGRSACARDGILISARPRIIYYPDFLSEEEIQAILATGEPKLKPARTDAGLKQDVRSSVATFFTPEEEFAVPAIAEVKRRAFQLTKLHQENQEELQMQRYKEPRSGQQDFYIPHYDSQQSHDRKRVCTLITYLEAPEEGGETIFPMVHVNSTFRHKHLSSHADITDMAMNLWRDGICAKVARGESDLLAIKPRRGAAVLFYTLMPDGKVDAHSIHGSCPVLKGQKTVCQQWINEAWMAPLWSPDVEVMEHAVWHGCLPRSSVAHVSLTCSLGVHAGRLAPPLLDAPRLA